MQHSPDLLDQLPRLGDDVGPCEADDASHLHGVPACPGGTVTAEEWEGTLEKDVRGVRVGRSGHLKQGRRTRVGFSSVLRILLCSYFRAVLSSGKF